MNSVYFLVANLECFVKISKHIMTHINWLFIGILVYLCSLCSSENSDNNGLGEDVAGTGWQYRYHSMSMYTMVVSKGCTYLAG